MTTRSNEKELETKITALLALDSPANYVCWEDAEESILNDLTDEVQAAKERLTK